METPKETPKKKKLTKKVFGKILNILSGSAMCIGGTLVMLKGSITEGVTLIVAGVAKMTAHELQTEQIKQVKQDVQHINDEVLKTSLPRN